MKKATFLFLLFITLTNAYCKTGFYKLLNDKVNDFVIEEDTVWVCTDYGTLLKIQFNDSIFKLDTIRLVNTVMNDLNSIVIDHNGVKWIGTQDGLFSYDGRSVNRYTTQNGLVSNIINSIAVDKQNKKWIATDYSKDEVVVINGSTIEVKKLHIDKINNINTIAFDKNDTLWLTTFEVEKEQSGIYQYKDSVINRYPINSYSLFIDSNENKWFATYDNIVYKIDGKNWEQTLKPGGHLNYDDFLFYEDYAGKIWVNNTADGLSVYHENQWNKLARPFFT